MDVVTSAPPSCIANDPPIPVAYHKPSFLTRGWLWLLCSRLGVGLRSASRISHPGVSRGRSNSNLEACPSHGDGRAQEAGPKQGSTFKTSDCILVTCIPLTEVSRLAETNIKQGWGIQSAPARVGGMGGWHIQRGRSGEGRGSICGAMTRSATAHKQRLGAQLQRP